MLKYLNFVVFLLGVEFVRPGILAQEIFCLSLNAIVGDHDLWVDFGHGDWALEERLLFFFRVWLLSILVNQALLVFEVLHDQGFLECAPTFNRDWLHH